MVTDAQIADDLQYDGVADRLTWLNSDCVILMPDKNKDGTIWNPYCVH